MGNYTSHYESSNGFWDFVKEVPLAFSIFFVLLALLVVSGFLYVIIRGLKMWVSNNNSEILKKRCTIVDKRTEVWGGSGESSANTNYYITFELDDRSRIELQIPANRFGLMVVGDQGELTYQGTRFKDFTL